MKSPAPGIVATLALLLLAGCAAEPTLDLGQPGKSLSYVPGSPSFDLEVAPSDTEGTVQVSISIPTTSLTFLKVGSGFAARLEIDVRAIVFHTDTLINDYAWSDTIAAATYEETVGHQNYLIARTLKFKPGRVIVLAEILDDATGKKDTRSEVLHVPAAEEIRPFLGRIILQTRTDGGEWSTVVPLHVPLSTPRLRASATIFGLRGSIRDSVRTFLLRFKLADVIPQAPYLYSDFLPTPGEPKSIWLDAPDTVRRVGCYPREGPDGKPLVTMPLQDLPSGLYRIVMQARLPVGNGEGDTVLTESRVLSIKSPTFPRPSTLQELIQSMSYILTIKERERLRNARSLNDAHDVFDSLWMSFRPTKERAAALIKRYYTRVEEANKMYTDLKEGWKTDRGMLYIVMGPPQDVMNSLDRQIWTVDVPGSSQQAQFVFRRIVVGQGDLSIQTYALYRDASYEWVWEQFLNQWRHGGSGW